MARRVSHPSAISTGARYLRIPEGKNVVKRLKLAPFMRENFKLIYANPHGTRSAIVSRGPQSHRFGLIRRL